MRTLPILLVLACSLVGCGDPPPSTTLAPEQKMPDVSKMSDADVSKLRQGDHAAERK